MPYLVEHNTYQLVDVNVGLAGAISFLNPLAIQLDLSLFGVFGLGPLQLDFQARLDAALSIDISWNPTAQIDAMLSLIGAISAGLVLPLPSINASADIAADLQLKIGGIQLILDAGLSLTLPAFNAVAAAHAALSANVGYLLWQGSGAQLGAELFSKISSEYGAAAEVYVLAFFLDANAFSAVSAQIIPSIPAFGVKGSTMFKVS